MNKGTLYLIPTVISEGTEELTLSPQIKTVLPDVRHFLAEDIRTARRYLSSLKVFESIESLHFEKLDKETKSADMPMMMKPLFEGLHMGVISESGCPGIADPGALAVKFAHQHDISVMPLVGPSSILLALMGSGLNGQRFAFQGYLPVDAVELKKTLKSFERESAKYHQTQIFIETPYRNASLFRNLINLLDQDTMLTVAIDLTGKESKVQTKSIRDWRLMDQAIPKKPAVFLFLSSAG